MSRFEFTQTRLSGLKVIQRETKEDSRGFLSRFYCFEELSEAGVSKPIAQINHTFTRKKGTVRGLHFQHPPYAETKIISCLKGKIFDIAIDLRKGSSTFLEWHSEILSDSNRKSLLIPEGYAHGFQTLTVDCELIYLHTVPYHSEAEGALNAIDPMLAIDWPLPIEDLSDRDRDHELIDENYKGLVL